MDCWTDDRYAAYHLLRQRCQGISIGMGRSVNSLINRTDDKTGRLVVAHVHPA